MKTIKNNLLALLVMSALVGFGAQALAGDCCAPAAKPAPAMCACCKCAPCACKPCACCKCEKCACGAKAAAPAEQK